MLRSCYTRGEKEPMIMKCKVLYMTKTGHSRKIAMEVATALGLEAVDAKSDPDLRGIDLLVVVGGIYAGRSNPELVSYIGKLEKNAFGQAVLVTSCASKKFFQKEVRAAMVERGIEVFPEEFVCRGNFLFMGWGHPDAKDFAEATAFVDRVIKTLGDAPRP